MSAGFGSPTMLSWGLKCIHCEQSRVRISSPPTLHIEGKGNGASIEVRVPLHCRACGMLSAVVIENTPFADAELRQANSVEPPVPLEKWREHLVSEAMADMLEPEGK